jgi:hypothetical protein
VFVRQSFNSDTSCTGSPQRVNQRTLLNFGVCGNESSRVDTTTGERQVPQIFSSDISENINILPVISDILVHHISNSGAPKIL